MHAIVVACKAFTFFYWNCHPLRETEVRSHDANVTMITKVAGRASQKHCQLKQTTKQCFRQLSMLVFSLRNDLRMLETTTEVLNTQLDHRRACHHGRVTTDVYGITCSIRRSKVNNHCGTKCV